MRRIGGEREAEWKEDACRRDWEEGEGSRIRAGSCLSIYLDPSMLGGVLKCAYSCQSSCQDNGYKHDRFHVKVEYEGVLAACSWDVGFPVTRDPIIRENVDIWVLMGSWSHQWRECEDSEG